MPSTSEAGAGGEVEAARDLDRHDLAEAVAEQLLTRWGVVFRDLAVRDAMGLPWRDLQWALRRLEDRGSCAGAAS